MIRFHPQLLLRFGLGLTLLGSLLGGSSQLQANETGSLPLANKSLQTDQGAKVERLGISGAPGSLTVQTDLLSSGLVSLTWQPAEGALTYQVLRGATPDVATATLLASNLTTLTFVDSQPPPEVDLYYWVRGADLEQTGPFSEPVTARQNVLQWTWSSTGSLTMPVILTNGWVAVGINRINLFDRPPNLGHLYALTPQGAVAWDYDTTSTGIIQPAVGPNGHLIAGFSRSNTNSFLLSLSPEGAKISESIGGPTGGFLAVGNDGTVFLLGRSTAFSPQIQAFSGAGIPLWADGIGSGSTVPRFALHPDGSLIVGSPTSLTVYEPTGLRRWSRGAFNLVWGEPALVAEDRLLAVNSRQELIAFRLDGSPLWTNRIATLSGLLAGPAVDSSGTSYLTDSGSVLHAINADGTERWQVPLPGPTPHVPSLDQAGRILLTTSAAITVVNTNGAILQQIRLPSAPTQAPVLTAEGNLLVVLNGQLRTYRHSQGLASDAPWPMARQNPRGSSAPPGVVPPPRTPEVLPVIPYGNQVRLQLEPWTRPTGYELWRADVPELNQAIRILDLPVGDSRLQDTNVIPGKTYYYWVRAQNPGGTSEFAGPVATSSIDLPRRWRLTDAGQTPPAIAPSGTIFTTGPDGLMALKPDGSLLWSLAGLGGQPVVAADGTLLLHSADQLSSFAPTGTTNWSQANLAPHPTAPSLSAAGLILMPGAGDQFTAYDSAGQVRWQFTEALSFTSSPSLDVDGTMAWVASNSHLQFRQSDGLSQKTGPLESNFSDVSAPPWTPDGKVLLQADSPSGLQAFRRDGTRAWMADSFLPTLSPPAVAADGSIFVRLSLVVTPGDGGRPWIVALNPDGTHRWKQRTDSMLGTPVLTANGLVLVNGTNSISAWNAADGQPRWILETQAAHQLLSPVLDHDGTLLVASFGALEAYDLGVGPAEAPWPMHRQNPRQSASLERPAGPLQLELKSAGSAELHFSVTAPGPAVILLESSNFQQWRRVAAVPTAGDPTELRIPRTESHTVFYRLVVP